MNKKTLIVLFLCTNFFIIPSGQNTVIVHTPYQTGYFVPDSSGQYSREYHQFRRTNASFPPMVTAMMEKIQELVFLENINGPSEKTLQELDTLYTSHTEIFNAALPPDFAIHILKKFIRSMQACHNGSLAHISRKKQEHVLCFFLNYCTRKGLEEIDPETGENVAHISASFHWFERYMKKLSEKADFNIQTTENDKYPGTTIFHSVAARLVSEIKKGNRCSRPITENALHFLKQYLNKTTIHVLTKQSLANREDKSSGRTFWDILPLKYHQELAQSFNKETIEALHVCLQDHPNKTFVENIKRAVPLKK